MDCHNLKLFGATIAIQLVVEEEDDQKQHVDVDLDIDETMTTKSNNSSSSSSSDENKKTSNGAAEKVIGCPRCKSMETKFCYFNNYNVNQPRHFCKGCQRYWTAGGALRNVPIGAGRRKLKPPQSQSQFQSHPQFHHQSPNSLAVAADNSSCLYLDPSKIQSLHFDQPQDQWRRTMPPPPTTTTTMTTHGAFHHVFPAKRRRTNSDGQNF